MKIAIFVPSWPPGNMANGIVTYADQIIPALRRLGHDVFVITPKKTDSDPRTIDISEFDRSITIWDRALHRLVPYSAIWQRMTSAIISVVRHLISNHGLDVFEIEETYGWSFAVSRLRIVPVVVRLHGPWFLNGGFDAHSAGRHASLRRQTSEGRGIKNAEFVTAPSAAVLSEVTSFYEYELPNCLVVPNPLDVVPAERKWDRANCDKDRLLFVGRFDRRKGGDMVLRVFAELATSYPNLTLTFVGPDSGIVGAGNEAVSFHNFVRRNISEELRPRIDFRGQLSHSEVMSIRKDSFITLVASQYEIMPYAVLEPMSLGCPIVSTSVGGIPEMIQDQYSGILVPSQEPGEMVSACKQLLSDPNFAAVMGDRAWKTCRKFYNSKVIADQTIIAYGNAMRVFKSDDSSTKQPGVLSSRKQPWL